MATETSISTVLGTSCGGKCWSTLCALSMSRPGARLLRAKLSRTRSLLEILLDVHKYPRRARYHTHTQETTDVTYIKYRSRDAMRYGAFNPKSWRCAPRICG